jgi:predicted  nucleic acid-binding Zn-ribbon protein
MTRVSAKRTIRSKVTVAARHISSLRHSDDVIDEIFDQHEQELAELENEIFIVSNDAADLRFEVENLKKQISDLTEHENGTGENNV